LKKGQGAGINLAVKKKGKKPAGKGMKAKKCIRLRGLERGSESLECTSGRSMEVVFKDIFN